MARAQAEIDLVAISRTAAQPLIDALGARTEPGGVMIVDDDSVVNGLRWVAAIFLIAFAGVAAVGLHIEAKHRNQAAGVVGIGVILWLGAWAALGPVRLFWRQRRLPWRPGVYAIGPHVVDARRARLRFFAISSVVADLDGDRGPHRPCAVRVVSSWKTHTIRIADRDVAMRVRDQLTSPRGDVLAPLVALSAAAKPGDPGGAPREPLALRFAFVTAALIAGAITPLITLVG
jgi:hypothetical protein